MCVCVYVRWLVLDTDTTDLVFMHTDGNEIISNVKYSPGKTSGTAGVTGRQHATPRLR